MSHESAPDKIPPALFSGLDKVLSGIPEEEFPNVDMGEFIVWWRDALAEDDQILLGEYLDRNTTPVVMSNIVSRAHELGSTRVEWLIKRDPNDDDPGNITRWIELLVEPTGQKDDVPVWLKAFANSLHGQTQKEFLYTFSCYTAIDKQTGAQQYKSFKFAAFSTDAFIAIVQALRLVAADHPEMHDVEVVVQTPDGSVFNSSIVELFAEEQGDRLIGGHHGSRPTQIES